MRHTVGMRQSVILTRKVDYAAFCQGAIMSFYRTMRLGVMRLGVVRLGVMRLGCMRHFTTPPFKTQQLILGTGTAIWWVTEPHFVMKTLPLLTQL